LLASGQVDFLFARGGVVLGLREHDAAFDYVIPGEGSLIWIDNLCLLAGAAQPRLAETFINYVLEAPVSVALAQANHNSLPNTAALALLERTDRENLALYPNTDTRQRLFFLVNLDPATTQHYDQTWADFDLLRSN
jgi:spermidine/putrescine-binding protein